MLGTDWRVDDEDDDDDDDDNEDDVPLSIVVVIVVVNPTVGTPAVAFFRLGVALILLNTSYFDLNLVTIFKRASENLLVLC